jgi:hypothetical protein
MMGGERRIASVMFASDHVMRPVPGGWYGSELASTPELWRVHLPGEVRDDLLSAAAITDPQSADLDADAYLARPRPRLSARTHALAAQLYRSLADGPGLAVLAGFPAQENPELTEAAYLLLGTLLGQPLNQGNGHLLGRVENVGRDASLPGAQGYRLPGALPFHVDRCADVVGLLCVRAAPAGGLSLLVSSKMVHNILLTRRPDLLPVLYEPIPIPVPALLDPDGQQPSQWCMVPVFSRAGDHFAAYYVRHLVEEAQRYPDAPRLTQRQLAALDAVEDVLATPGLPLEMNMQPGDLQLISNLSVLHARTAYDQAAAGQGRLLLRQHLAFAGSPALPKGYAPLFGVTAAGTYRGGSWRTAQIRGRFGTPLQAAGTVSGVEP